MRCLTRLRYVIQVGKHVWQILLVLPFKTLGFQTVPMLSLSQVEQVSLFQAFSPRASALTYDICFNNWALDVEKYSTDDFKKWYNQTESALGNQNILFDFWCNEHPSEISGFIERFTVLFNHLADQSEVDALPTVNHEQASEDAEC